MPLPKKRTAVAEEQGPAVPPMLIGLGLLLSGSVAVFAFLEYVSPDNNEKAPSRPVRIETPPPSKIDLPEPASTSPVSRGAESPGPPAAPVTNPSRRVDAAVPKVHLRPAVPEIAAHSAPPASIRTRQRPQSRTPPPPERDAAPPITVPEFADASTEGVHSAVSPIPAEPAYDPQPAPPQEPPPDTAALMEPTIAGADAAPHTPEAATGAADTSDAAPATDPLPEPDRANEKAFENSFGEAGSPDPANGMPQSPAPPSAEPRAGPPVALPESADVPAEGEHPAIALIPAEPAGQARSAVPADTAAPVAPPIVPASPPHQAGSAAPTTSGFEGGSAGEASPLVQPAPDLERSRSPSGQFVQSYPVTVLDGVEIGAIPMRISADNVISIYLGSFLSLFQTRMDPDIYQRLSSARAADQYISLDVLRSYGLNMTYDSKHERLILDEAE